MKAFVAPMFALATVCLACSPSGGGRGSSGTGTGTTTGGTTGGTTTGGTTTGGGGEVPASVASDVAAAACDLFVGCFGDLASTFFPSGNCVDSLTRRFEQEFIPMWQLAIDKGTVTYEHATLTACIGVFKNTGCDSLPDFNTACDDALIGHVAAGGECENTIECAGTAFCDVDTACPGVCTDRVDEGAACDLDVECAVGLMCAQNTCATPLGAGDACGGEGAADCTLGLLCKAAGFGQPGICTPIEDLPTAGNGQACDLGKLELCDSGLSCVLQSDLSSKCQSKYAKGASCAFGVPDPCSQGEFCTSTFENPDGKCTPLPGDGEPCGEGGLGGGLCGDGLTCAEETCEPFRDLGGQCKVSAQCYSGSCADSVCVAPTLCEE